MFHLLVSYNGWPQSSGSIDLSRVFEYTDENMRKLFKPRDVLNLTEISRIPALFVSESGGSGEQIVHVGYINNISKNRKDVNLHYTFDSNIPPITNSNLETILGQLNVDPFELQRTHWSVKDIDLFKVLFTKRFNNIPRPKVFSIENMNLIEDNLISAMMPFSSGFDNVYSTIQKTSKALDLNCLRADDIWESDAVIQDVISLISKSRIVVCDCTDRNANVFYEIGISHTLGKDVILITQSDNDIPFDLRHLRYLPYLNNAEGRKKLLVELTKRISTILGTT